MRVNKLVTALLLCLAIASSAFAEPGLPALTSPVTDLADLLPLQDVRTLERQINEYRDSTDNRIYVLVVTSVGDTAIEDYAHAVFNQNRLGDSLKNNGVLLVVAIDDRQARIEVGYGLEAALTDLECGRIVKGEDTPMAINFNEEDYVGGIGAVIQGIIQGIGGEYTAPDADGEIELSPRTILILSILLFVLFIILWIVTGSPLEAAIIILRIVAIAASKGGSGGGGGRSGGGGASGRW